MSTEETPGEATVELVGWNGYMVPASCSVTRDLLGIRNAHLRDEAVAFDEAPHRYWVYGACWAQSITGAIGAMFETFDARAVAEKMVRSSCFAACRGDKAKYQSIVDRWRAEEQTLDAVRDAVMAFWEKSNGEASQMGTEMHAAIENHYNVEEAARLRPVGAEEEEAHLRTLAQHDLAEHVRARVEFSKQFLAYAGAVAERGWVAYRTEMRVFCAESKLVGSVDMIYQDTATKEFHLRDWKRSKKISRRAFSPADRGFGAFRGLEACNFNKYSIQLGVYRKILRLHYGIDCKTAALVVFHPDQTAFAEFDAAPYADEIDEFFASRVAGVLSDLK